MPDSSAEHNAAAAQRKAGRPRRMDGRSTAEARYTIPDTLLIQLEQIATARGESRDAVVTALLAAGVTDMAMRSTGASHPVPSVSSKPDRSAEKVAEHLASEVEVQLDQAVERQVERLRDDLMDSLAGMIEERIVARVEHAVDHLAGVVDERDRRIAAVVSGMAQLVSEISSGEVRTRAKVEALHDESKRLVDSTRALSGNINSMLELLAGMTGVALQRQGG